MLDSMHLEMAQFQGVPWSMSMSPVKSGALGFFTYLKAYHPLEECWAFEDSYGVGHTLPESLATYLEDF